YLPVLQADVVDRDDAGMAEPGEAAGLLEESLGCRALLVEAAAKNLDGHGPVELRVVAEVHRAEPAGSQRLPHLIAAEGGGHRYRDRAGPWARIRAARQLGGLHDLASGLFRANVGASRSGSRLQVEIG